MRVSRLNKDGSLDLTLRDNGSADFSFRPGHDYERDDDRPWSTEGPPRLRARPSPAAYEPSPLGRLSVPLAESFLSRASSEHLSVNDTYWPLAWNHPNNHVLIAAIRYCCVILASLPRTYRAADSTAATISAG
jgi:hypothetical protein